MHKQPHELAPKTEPLKISKLGLARVLQLDDSTENSEIAVQSIMPDDVPQPENERRNVNAPGASGPFGQVFVNPDRAQATQDQLDIDSGVVGTYLPQDDEGELDIEREVDLKTKKARIPKKQINKYESVPVAGAAMSDLGGVGRKVGHAPNSDGKVAAVSEPVYEIKEPTKSLFGSTGKKQTATVSLNRRTGQVGQYEAVDTRSNVPNSKDGPQQQGRPSYAAGYAPYEDERERVKGDKGRRRNVIRKERDPQDPKYDPNNPYYYEDEEGNEVDKSGRPKRKNIVYYKKRDPKDPNYDPNNPYYYEDEEGNEIDRESRRWVLGSTVIRKERDPKDPQYNPHNPYYYEDEEGNEVDKYGRRRRGDGYDSDSYYSSED